MTPRQRNFIFGTLWPATCAVLGLDAESREARHDWAATHGLPESWADWNNKHITEAMASMQAVTAPDDLDTQLRYQRNEARQVRHRITHALAGELSRLLGGATEADDYIIALVRDKFGTDDLLTLSLDQLTQLRNTLIKRIRNKARAQEPQMAPMPQN